MVGMEEVRALVRSFKDLVTLGLDGNREVIGGVLTRKTWLQGHLQSKSVLMRCPAHAYQQCPKHG